MKSMTLFHRITQKPFLVDLIAAFLSFLVYLKTLAPGVTTGDSGELITAAVTLGIPHPTGYPLYVILGRIFITPFFFLRPDLAMNLFSAVCASIAVALFRRLAFIVTARVWTSFTLALAFALIESLWSQATTARVYCLNACLVLAVLIEVSRFFVKNEISLKRAWLFFGLGMANHTITIILLPILLWVTWAKKPSPMEAMRQVYPVIFGALLYLYIPIAASLQPYQNFGDPSTPERLFRYLTRANYWHRRYVENFSDVVTVFLHYLKTIPEQFSWLGTILICVGFFYGFLKKNRLAYIGTYLFLANIFMMMLHASHDDIFHWPRYLITGYIGLAMLAVLALKLLTKPPFFAPLLGVCTAVLAFAQNLKWCDRSDINFARDFNLKILERVEKGAKLFAEGDNCLFPLIYLHHVEGIRPDITLVLQGVNVLDPMVINPSEEPIYFTHHHNLGSPEIDLIPDGLIYRMVKKGDPLPKVGQWDEWAIPSFEEVTASRPLRYLDRNLVGDYLFMKAVVYEKTEFYKAESALDKAMEIDFDNKKTFLNAGLIFERAGLAKRALDAFERALQIDKKDELAQAKTAFWRSVFADVKGAKDQADLFSRLAVSTYAKGRADISLAILRRAVAMLPDSFQLRYNLAALLIAQNDLQGAKQELLKCLELKPGDPTASRDLSEIEKRLSRGSLWYSEDRDVFGGIESHVEADFTGKEDKKSDTVAKAWAVIDEVNKVFNVFEPSSEVSRINESKSKQEVTVSQALFDCLLLSRKAFEMTQGAFDPTVMPLKRIWKMASSDPPSALLQETLKHIGLSKVTFGENRKISFRDPLVELDFGGVAKGYAVDRIAKVLDDAGVTSYLVRIGGEISCKGSSPRGEPWVIGITDPTSPKKPFGALLAAKPLSVSTSGPYNQPVNAYGMRVNHIYDPRTGKPVSSDVQSVTVVFLGDNHSVGLADALATGLSVLPIEQGLMAIRSLKNAYALFLVRDSSGQIKEVMTQGLDAFYRRVEVRTPNVNPVSP